ncbi:MAG: hypothetical protein QM760_10810 [Nibricoccus sp.]
MQKLVANSKRKLTYVYSPAGVTCAMPSEINVPAIHTRAGGSPVILKEIQLSLVLTGSLPAGAFAGTASGSITASTPRVQGEGQSLLVLGDQVTLTCNDGTTTAPGSSPVSTPASVQVTITDAGQISVFANRP